MATRSHPADTPITHHTDEPAAQPTGQPAQRPAPVLPGRQPGALPSALRPLPLTAYQVTSGFWAGAQAMNREAFIPHCDTSLERVGWVDNLRAVARGTQAQERVGRLFTDSEVHKTMEAMSWELARKQDAGLQERLHELVAVVAGAQQDDGYLNSYYGYPGGPERYSDLEWGHELYCAGHLLQAAVAAARAGQTPELPDVARRLADHVCDRFGPSAADTASPAPGAGADPDGPDGPGIDGHPEIETALVELYRLTGEKRYLDQAKSFVDRRGHRTLADTMYRGRAYYQDDTPVREATTLVGHAVRALYLVAGVIDVAVETGDEELLQAARRQYDAALARRTYLTGGMGSNHHGETFGDDFELPSERAYAETCAAIASVQVAWRLLLATGETRYGDVIERTLFNAVMSSPSQDGTEFFYVNTLQRRVPGTDPEPGVPSLRRTDGRRAAWFTTSCCPTNTARLLASLGAYLATADEGGVQVHQYATGELHADFGARDIRSARLDVQTAYPLEGEVTFTVLDTDQAEWTLTLRVPVWAEGARIVVHPADGSSHDVEAAPGAVSLRRQWAAGDVVRLHLPIEPRLTHPDPRIDALRGCVAVERGPLVYAAESVDNPGVDLDLLSLDVSQRPRTSANDVGLQDAVALVTSGQLRAEPRGPWPYTASGSRGGTGGTASPEEVGSARETRQVELVLIPYFRWANRGASTMRVWLPTDE